MPSPFSDKDLPCVSGIPDHIYSLVGESFLNSLLQVLSNVPYTYIFLWHLYCILADYTPLVLIQNFPCPYFLFPNEHLLLLSIDNILILKHLQYRKAYLYLEDYLLLLKFLVLLETSILSSLKLPLRYIFCL